MSTTTWRGGGSSTIIFPPPNRPLWFLRRSARRDYAKPGRFLYFVENEVQRRVAQPAEHPAEEYEIALLGESIQLAEQHPVFGAIRCFSTYRDILALMEQPENESIYRRLEDIAYHHLHLFRPADRYPCSATWSIQVFNYTIKISLRNTWVGNSGSISWGMEKGLFFDEYQLSDMTFLNIIVTASVLGELDWIEELHRPVCARITAAQQVDAVSLGTAYWYLPKAIFRLQRLASAGESSYLQYQLRVKSLSLRNYFELFLQDETYYELAVYESKAFQGSFCAAMRK